MKILASIPLVVVVFIAFSSSSCRTLAPLDPTTMKPSDQCLPGQHTVVTSAK